MTALVLLQHGLDVGLDVEPGPAGEVRHRDGRRWCVANRADRAALEWALALADPVIALTVGPAAAEETLAHAVARGAARGIRIWDEALAEADLSAASRVVAAAVTALAPELLLAGERGLEGATGMLPALVAVRLDWPCAEGALRVAREPGAVVIERRLPDGRREEVAADCPAVVTVTAESVEPRYVSVGARRRAAGRVERWGLDRVGTTADAVRRLVRLAVDRVDWPRPRAKRTAQGAPTGSAAERLRQLGGEGRRGEASPDPASRLVEGTPAELAERILAFLDARGLL